MKKVSISIETLNQIIIDILITCKQGYYTPKEIELYDIFCKHGYKTKSVVYRTILSWLTNEGHLKSIYTSKGVAYKTTNLISDVTSISNKYFTYLTSSKRLVENDNLLLNPTPISKEFKIGDSCYIFDDGLIIECKIITITQFCSIEDLNKVNIHYTLYNATKSKTIEFYNKPFFSIQEVIEDLINHLNESVIPFSNKE